MFHSHDDGKYFVECARTNHQIYTRCCNNYRLFLFFFIPLHFFSSYFSSLLFHPVFYTNFSPSRIYPCMTTSTQDRAAISTEKYVRNKVVVSETTVTVLLVHVYVRSNILSRIHTYVVRVIIYVHKSRTFAEGVEQLSCAFSFVIYSIATGYWNAVARKCRM